MVPRAQRQARPAKKSAGRSPRKTAGKTARKTANKAAKQTTKKTTKKSTKKTAKKTAKKSSKKAEKKITLEPPCGIKRAAKWKTTGPVARTSTRGTTKATAESAPEATLKPRKPVSKPPKLDVGPDVMEFIAAIDDYKRQYHRPFPGWSEILFVLTKLGYRKAKPKKNSS